ncbi:MAG: BlaI/MecI/CopY family transcriptional regulator [Thermoanaerobaculia bacterium]
MGLSTSTQLSRRERQIMDVIYARGRATVAEVREDLPAAPSYNAVRALLRILEEKGHLRHEQEGPRYVFLPTVPAEKARDSALRHLLRTFFDGSAEGAVAALLDLEAAELSPQEFERLAERIEKARKEGR